MNRATEIDDVKRWIVALAIASAVIAVVLSIALRIDAPPRRVNAEKACLSSATDDEHASLEAFFQNPSGDDALKQASLSCAKRAPAGS